MFHPIWFKTHCRYSFSLRRLNSRQHDARLGEGAGSTVVIRCLQIIENGNTFRGDDMVLGEDHHSVYMVSQLPDVARIIIINKEIPGFFVNAVVF